MIGASAIAAFRHGKASLALCATLMRKGNLKMKTITAEGLVNRATATSIKGEYPGCEYNEDFEITATETGLDIDTDGLTSITITWDWILNAYNEVQK